jgi:hypothetical protein
MGHGLEASRQHTLKRRWVNLTGHRFGHWTVLNWVTHSQKWNCLCKCGRTYLIASSKLKFGKSTQCVHCRRLTHGLGGNKGTPTYGVWKHMRQRCFNPRCKDYKHYGGRGITVCDRWQDFEAFRRDMGEKPQNMSIDRIDINGNYSPSNCRWATQKQQTRNTRRNRLIRHGGLVKPLAVWCELLHLPYSRIHKRLKRGWSVEEALDPRSI